MLEFIILMIVIDLLCKIKFGEKVEEKADFNPYDNGTAEKYIRDNSWQFESLDDCFEFRELRLSGWKGGIKEFYEWKNEE